MRLVKGAYWDAEIIQAQQEGGRAGLPQQGGHRRKLRAAGALSARSYRVAAPTFASHLALGAFAIAEPSNPPGDLEFQMLYGMAEGLMETVSNLGYRRASTRRSARCSRAWHTWCVAS